MSIRKTTEHRITLKTYWNVNLYMTNYCEKKVSTVRQQFH